MYLTNEVQQPAVVTQSLPYGGELNKEKALAYQNNYLENKANGTISSNNCPEMVLFNLGKLKDFLEKAEAVCEQLNIPEENRGIAVMPMMYEKNGQMNMMFAPCVKDANGKVIHTFNVTNENTDVPDAEDWWEILWQTIWNHGSGI